MADESVGVRCSGCGASLGHYAVGPDGRAWLRVGALLLYSGHGVCGACGLAWHWNVGDRELELLLSRLTKPRESL